jgi:hypothetical protein
LGRPQSKLCTTHEKTLGNRKKRVKELEEKANNGYSTGVSVAKNHQNKLKKIVILARDEQDSSIVTESPHISDEEVDMNDNDESTEEPVILETQMQQLLRQQYPDLRINMPSFITIPEPVSYNGGTSTIAPVIDQQLNRSRWSNIRASTSNALQIFNSLLHSTTTKKN